MAKKRTDLQDGHDVKEVETSKIKKARIWWAVLYLENMIIGWQDLIADILQLPFVYCIHDKDRDEKGELRKAHMHIILVFPNTTTYNHALEIFRLLGAKAVNKCEAVIGIRNTYEYLIHNTKTCQKLKKYQYSPEERISGNNFDIGAYEQLSTEEKYEILKEFITFITDNAIDNLADFFTVAYTAFPSNYVPVAYQHNALLDRVCKGVYINKKKHGELLDGRPTKN